MEATAKLRYLRMSPRKVRLVADLIRGKDVGSALDLLKYLDKKAAKPLSLLLQSAAANAGNKEGMDTETLYISSLMVNEGPMWKRHMPRSRGMAYPILKKTSHVELKLEDRPRKEASVESTPAANASKSETNSEEVKPQESASAEAPKKGRKKSVKTSSNQSKEKQA